jgi:hypothetical protein
MTTEKNKVNDDQNAVITADNISGDVTMLGNVDEDCRVNHAGGISYFHPQLQEHETAVDPSCLLKDQRRAYDIIDWHLSETLAGRNPPQLLMQIPGEGGVGKSKMI